MHRFYLAPLLLAISACQPALWLSDYAPAYEVQGLTVTVHCTIPLGSGCAVAPEVIGR